MDFLKMTVSPTFVKYLFMRSVQHSCFGYSIQNKQCFPVVLRVTIKSKQRNLTEKTLKTRFGYKPHEFNNIRYLPGGRIITGSRAIHLYIQL